MISILAGCAVIGIGITLALASGLCRADRQVQHLLDAAVIPSPTPTVMEDVELADDLVLLQGLDVETLEALFLRLDAAVKHLPATTSSVLRLDAEARADRVAQVLFLRRAGWLATPHRGTP